MAKIMYYPNNNPGAPVGTPPGGPGGMPPGGMPPGGGPGGPGGMPPGGPGGFPGGGPPPMESAAEKAAIYVDSGELTDGKEDDSVILTVAEGAPGVSDKIASGVKLSSGAYDANGFAVVTGGEYVFGGKDNYFTVNGKEYNSVLDFTVDTHVSANDKGGTGVGVADSAALIIDNSYLKVDGSSRYVTAAYGSSSLIINDSDIISTGRNENTIEIAEPRSNSKLLLYGYARTNFSVGSSKTYFYNSNCIAEGWAALSTDSSRDKGLDLYAYQSYAEATNGGYGTYADFNCRVWLYGSVLKAAEMGAIISKDGKVALYDNLDATTDGCLAYASKAGAKLGSQRIRSQLIGGRNSIMIHAPDMMGQGIDATDTSLFEVYGGLLKTDNNLKTVFDYEKNYGKAVAKYVEYISGSAILVKSTSAFITLKNAEIETYNNTLVHTVINSDSMNNLLKEGDSDDPRVDGINVLMSDMSATGDIRHEDYQRKMNLRLENTTLTGAVISGTCESWNETWKAFKGDPDCCWTPNEEWNAPYGVNMTMAAGSKWVVTGKSDLNTLVIEPGAEIIGKMTVSGTQTAISPGAYKDVVVTV